MRHFILVLFILLFICLFSLYWHSDNILNSPFIHRLLLLLSIWVPHLFYLSCKIVFCSFNPFFVYETYFERWKVLRLLVILKKKKLYNEYNSCGCMNYGPWVICCRIDGCGLYKVNVILYHFWRCANVITTL